MDMDIHRLRPADAAEFAKRPEAISLLLTERPENRFEKLMKMVYTLFK